MKHENAIEPPDVRDAREHQIRVREHRPIFTPPNLSMPPQFLRPSIRHLLYHCCPLAENDTWRECAAEIVQRWGAFNGRKVVAIAQGAGCLSADDVRAVWPEDCEFLILPNCPLLRETVSFLPLLLSVHSRMATEATFYFHSKGNSTAGDREAAQVWRQGIVDNLLGDWSKCMDALERYVAAGTTKMNWPPGHAPFPNGLQRGVWMFAGTGFWFRHDLVFLHKHWRQIPVDRYGTEAWLGGLIDSPDAVSMWQPWPEEKWPAPSPYELSTYGLSEQSSE